jgi:hypothetical protein
MLRVTAAPKVAKPGYAVLTWRVDSIEETIQALAGNGVDFTRYDGVDQDVSAVWTLPGGHKVAWFNDPLEKHLGDAVHLRSRKRPDLSVRRMLTSGHRSATGNQRA